MIQRLLVANRGEISIRIGRTARDMGIEYIAIYSDADRNALHVILSDRAYRVGPPESEKSYLNMEKIIEIAKSAGADAIHPGYGFLSENAEFAQKVIDAGLIFIGPPPEAMKLMGDKLQARKLAQKVGVPTVPGSKEGISSIEEGIELARKIGFPVLLKAAMGGGGKGMRVVRSEEEFSSAFKLAQAEALGAFGDSTIYIEKFIENPRHVEMQIIADKYGNVVYLGERECSIQRRHQKIIEESPSPIMTPEKREEMGEAAVELIKAAGYYNAGTVEFLVDNDLNFYFLEVNARLQVEHPVTEMRLGMDLVKEQLKVAMGEKLSYSQKDIEPKGWAIEARIYAEDPANNFFPSPGLIKFLREPQGPYIRVDSGVYQGYEVPIYYDPMLSKLIAWGENREEALNRLERALNEYIVFGIKTAIDFHRKIINDERFRRGEIHTGFLNEFHYTSIERKKEAAIAGVLVHSSKSSLSLQKPPKEECRPDSKWKIIGRELALKGGFDEILG